MLSAELLAEVSDAVFARLAPGEASVSRRSFEVALTRATNAFVRNYPQLGNTLLAKEFLTGQAVPTFVDTVREGATPDPAVFAAGWDGHGLVAATEFLRWLDAELSARPAPDSLPDALAGASTYAVTVERAQGIAIGDNATVNNVFNTYFDRDYATLADYYLPPNEVFDRVQVEDFVGRANLLADLDEFLDTTDHGTWLLVGEAGVGKSTLLAHLVRERGYLHFFAEQAAGTANVSRAVQSLAAQLISRFRIAPYAQRDTVPGLLAAYPDFLRKLLSDAAAKLVHGERLVIVIDALDEAGEIPGQNVLGLPRRLPKGVYLVLSQRDENVPLVIEPAPRRVDLRAKDTANQADMVDYLRRQARVPTISQQLRAHDYSTDDFVRTLLEKSTGNWIYLHYVLKEIREGQRAPLNLAGLPDNLATYYVAHWARWREDPAWDALYAPLLVTLGAAFDPLPLPVLKRWAGVAASDYQLRRILRDKWGAFVYEIAEEERQYRLYHASLNDFLAGDLVSETNTPYAENLLDELADRTMQAHRNVVADLTAQCAGQWPELARDDYARRFLTAHLRLSGNLDRLFALVDSAEWYEAQMSADPSGIAYLTDADQAWVAAEPRNLHAVTNGEPAPMLAREVRAAIAIARIGDISANIPSVLLAELVTAGLWTPAQALATANLQPDTISRNQSLAELARSFVEAGFLVDALDAVRAIDEVSRQSTVLTNTVFPALPDGALRDALGVVLGIANGAYLAEALKTLAPRLPVPLLREARERIELIDEPNDRQWALRTLTPFLPEADQPAAWLDTLAAIRLIAAQSTRCRMFALVAPHLDDERRATELADLFAMSQEIADPQERAECLKPLVALVPEHERESVRDTIITLAELIDDAEARITTSVGMAADLPEPRREAFLADIVELVETEPDIWRRQHLLESLAHYADWHHVELSPAMRDRIFRTAMGISTKSIRLEAVAGVIGAKLAPPLDEPTLRDLLRLVLDEVSSEGYNTYNITELLRDLMPVLPEPLLTEFRADIGMLAPGYTRDQVLYEIRDRMADPGTDPSPEVPDMEPRWEIPPIGPFEERAPADELAAVWGTRVDDDYRLAAVRTVAPHLTDDLLPEAVDVVLRADGQHTQAQGLAHLAGHLSEELCLQALSLATDVWEEYARATVLISLCDALPPASVPKAVAMAAEIGHTYNAARALAHLARRLAGTARDEVIGRCVSFVETDLYVPHRAGVMALLSPLVDEHRRLALLDLVLTAVDNEEEMLLRPRALEHIIPVVPDSWLPRVSAIVADTAAVGPRAQAFVLLADRLPTGERDAGFTEMIALARSASRPYSRFEILSAVLPRLPDELRTVELAGLVAETYHVLGYQLYLLLPYMERTLQQDLLPLALDELMQERMLDEEVKTAFQGLVPIMATLSPADMYQLWNSTLINASRWSATRLLSAIDGLWPILEVLGGPDAPTEVARVILRPV
jgi:AAA ATPase domain